jgi:transcriptional regulator with XRE-family HTH domain
MQFHEALGAVIRDERQAQNLTLRDVACNGFVSMGHLSDVENGRKQGSSQFITAVATALSMEPSELIIEAGYLMKQCQIPDTPESLFVPVPSIQTIPSR